MPRLALLICLLLTACTPNLDPVGGAAYYGAQVTEIARAESTQIAAQPVTQSYLESEYAKSLTATALPPQQTATEQALQLADIAITQAWDNRTATAVAQTVAYSQTQVVMTLWASDAQASIADNNRAIAESQYRANAMQWVCYGGAGVLLFGLVAFVAIALHQGQQALITARQVYERRAWDKAEIETEVKAREFGLIVTSSGFTTSRTLAAPIAEQKANRYSHDQAWRTATKKLVEHGVIAGQGGAKHPFSETTLSQYVIRPESGAVWLDGYRKLSKVLQDNGLWVVAGPRIAPVWGEGWNWDRFKSEFDLTPLHHLPEGNPPNVKTPAWSFAESA